MFTLEPVLGIKRKPNATAFFEAQVAAQRFRQRYLPFRGHFGFNDRCDSGRSL
jgi:hypothetical protein